MRKDRLKINKAIGLKEIKDDLRQMLREKRTLALQHMEEAAEYMFDRSNELVPVDTGELQYNIEATVSRNPRYPGVILTTWAKNPKTGYDYAYKQETDETYVHPNGRQAHFLEIPYREAVDRFFKEMGWI